LLTLVVASCIFCLAFVFRITGLNHFSENRNSLICEVADRKRPLPLSVEAMLPVAVSSQVVASLQVVALSPAADWLLAAAQCLVEAL